MRVGELHARDSPFELLVGFHVVNARERVMSLQRGGHQPPEQRHCSKSSLDHFSGNLLNAGWLRSLSRFAKSRFEPRLYRCTAGDLVAGALITQFRPKISVSFMIFSMGPGHPQSKSCPQTAVSRTRFRETRT